MMNEFGYYSQPEAAMGFGWIVGVFVAIYLIILLLTAVFSVACYIFQSLGLYTLANRRGIHNPWLAWLPVGNLWILGSVSDQYQYVAKGRVRNRRKVLLGLMIAIYALMIPEVIFSFWMGFSEGEAGSSAAPVILFVLTVLALSAVAIIATVFQYIACYDLFESSNPKNATLYLVLAIVFPVVLPFFLFACRNQDQGMPPRKSPAQPALPVQPVVTEVPVPICATPVAAEPVVMEETAEECAVVEDAAPAEEEIIEEVEETPETVEENEPVVEETPAAQEE